MRIGCFEIDEPVPECNEPYAIATLRPWIDVNSIGSLVLRELKSRYGAFKLGRLYKPGSFYDFTRYRPTINLEEGIRDMSIPNSTVYYAKGMDRMIFCY